MAEWDAPDTPYRQIVEALREKIETEELVPGDKLPPNRALMHQFSAGSQTVQRAVRILREAGLVESRGTSGVFVRRPPQAIQRSASFTKAPAPGERVPYKATSHILHLGLVPARPYVADRLGVDVGEAVFLRRRLMMRDGLPVEIVSSFYPASLAEGTELASEKSLTGGSPAALERLGFACVKTTEWVFTRMPLREEIELLQITGNAPVLRLLRVVFAAGDRPVEVIEMIMDGKRNVLRYDM